MNCDPQPNTPEADAHVATVYRRDPLRSVHQAVVDRVVVVDEGTGEGSRIARALSCTEPPIDAVGPPLAGDEHRFTLFPSINPRWLGVRDAAGAVAYWPTVEAADRLLGRITRFQLDRAGSPPLLHAASVSTADGLAVVLLGESGAGKSTLTAHLLRLGFDLLTDEQLVVDRERGEVSAFSRPIAIKPGGVDFLPAFGQSLPHDRSVLLSPESLGSRRRMVAQPTLVVELARQDLAECKWIELEPVKAVEVLAANNLDLERDPLAGMEAFAWVASTVTAVRLVYPTSAQAALAVMTMLDSPPPAPSVSWSVVSEGPPPELSAEGVPVRLQSPSGTVDRSTGVVKVEIGDETLLFQPRVRTLIHLDHAGAAWWGSLPVELPVGRHAGAFLSELHSHEMVIWTPISWWVAFMRRMRRLVRRQLDDRAGPRGGIRPNHSP